MGRNRLPLVVAGVVGLLLVVLLRNVLAGGDDTENTAGGDGNEPREGCVAFTLAASPEKSGLLAEVASEYEKADRKVAGTCVDVQVAEKSSGAAEEALARGWNEQRDGARPDVWSPAASTWLALLRQDAAKADIGNLLTDKNPSIANTPLVLAMPKPMAEALGWPRTPIGWSDVLALSRSTGGWASKGHPEWSRFKLGKTSPFRSTSGLAATVGTFVAATGRSSDLTAADLAKPAIRDFAKAVEGSVYHYGDTTLTFLTNMQRADDAGQGLSYVSAVAVEEKSVLDYNAGNPSANPQTAGKHAPPKVPLVAVYPKEGTLNSDNPYAVLNAPWVDADKKAAAADFLEYLLGDKGQRRFTESGFRDATGKPGAALQRSQAVRLDQPKIVLDPPSPPVLTQVRTSWNQLRKRARVLLVLDVSGSMGEPVGKAGGRTKLDLAKEAASGALKDFAPDDEVGLWAFTTDMGGAGRIHSEISPLAPIGPRLAQVRKAINALVPLNGTPLYAVTRASVRDMSGKIAPDRINAVVLLTDGKNEYPQDSDLKGLVSSLQTSESATGSVRVFSIAYGENADLDVLKQISEASRAAAYDATDPTSIERIFTAVVSNF